MFDRMMAFEELGIPRVGIHLYFEKAVGLLIKMNMMTNMALEVQLKNSVPGEANHHK